MPPAQADIILNGVLTNLNIQNGTFEAKYNQIPAIVKQLILKLQVQFLKDCVNLG